MFFSRNGNRQCVSLIIIALQFVFALDNITGIMAFVKQCYSMKNLCMYPKCNTRLYIILILHLLMSHHKHAGPQ